MQYQERLKKLYKMDNCLKCIKLSNHFFTTSGTHQKQDNKKAPAEINQQVPNGNFAGCQPA
jgi:hypothetical protein